MSLYAYLDPVSHLPADFREIDPAVYSAWQSAGNPKANAYRFVNMTAQPTFDANTQQVVQNGWTVTATDVQPVWVVQALTTDQQATVTAHSNRVTLITNAINNLQDAQTNWPTLTAAKKDQVLQNLTKLVAVLLNEQRMLFGA